MSSAMARGSATQPPELTPERVALLRVQAFALGQVQALEVSPQRESDTAPPLAVSRGAAAETLSRSENTETDLSARVTIGDGVSPLTIDTSPPVSTGIPETLHPPLRRSAPAMGMGRGPWRTGVGGRHRCDMLFFVFSQKNFFISAVRSVESQR